MIPITPENYPHGIICGCACDCSKPLNDGNAMEQDVDDIEDVPEFDRDKDPDAHKILVIICAECYVGNHKPKK